MSESADARLRDKALEERLANRRSPSDPDYDAFYDATDAELAAMVSAQALAHQGDDMTNSKTNRVEITLTRDQQTVVLDGHEVSPAVRSLVVSAEAQRRPRLELDVPIVDALRVDLDAAVTLPHHVEDLLLRLGWSPPGMAQVTPASGGPTGAEDDKWEYRAERDGCRHPDSWDAETARRWAVSHPGWTLVRRRVGPWQPAPEETTDG